MQKGAAVLVGIFAAVVAMAGCGPSVTCDVAVNSFAAINAGSYRSYVMLPLNPGLNDSDLEFQEYSWYVRKTLNARGFVPANSIDSAQIVIYLGYGVGDPRQIGGGGSRTTSTVLPMGNAAIVKSRTTYDSQETVFTRYAVVKALDQARSKTEQRPVEVWSTSIASVGATQDLRAIFPMLIAGAFDLIGQNSAGIKVRTVDVDGPMAQWMTQRGVYAPGSGAGNRSAVVPPASSGGIVRDPGF